MLLIVAKSTRYESCSAPDHTQPFALRKKCRLLHSGTLIIQSHAWALPHAAQHVESGGSEMCGHLLVSMRNRKLLDFMHWDSTYLQFLSRALNTPCLNYWHDMKELLALPCCRAHPSAPQADTAPSSQWAAAQPKHVESVLCSQKRYIFWLPQWIEGWTQWSWRYFPI